ncbi:MAG: elongation factor P [Candidatus Dadabacteria bacterium]|nr:MAG: elongation factor P [Candidatus Dadabacteria bacterium]
MYDTSDFRGGLKILIDGAPWEVIEFLHVKPGKGAAFVRAKVRNLLTGAVVEKKFRAGEKFGQPDLVYKKMQYLYEDNGFVFMDLETYDQVTFSEEQVGDARRYLKENENVDVVFFEGRPITVSVANHIVLQITETDPGVKGDTVSGGTKPATLETGAVVQVPLFLKEGDYIKVDTRTDAYIERVSGPDAG